MGTFNAIIQGILRGLKAHKTRHGASGPDEIDLSGLEGTQARLSYLQGEGGHFSVVENRFHYVGDDGIEYYIQGTRIN